MGAISSFFRTIFAKCIFFVIIAIVGLLFILAVETYLWLGYTDKKAQSIIEDMFPTCEMCGKDVVKGQLLIHMRTEDGIDFDVIYRGEQRFDTNYGEAILNANMEEIEKKCPEGVRIEISDFDLADSTYHFLRAFIYGEEYNESAALFFAEIEELLSTRYVKPKQKLIEMHGYIYLQPLFYNPKTKEYVWTDHAVRLSFYSPERKGFEGILEYLTAEYSKLYFVANITD